MLTLEEIKRVRLISRILIEVNSCYFTNTKNIFYRSCMENGFEDHIKTFDRFIKMYVSILKKTFELALSNKNHLSVQEKMETDVAKISQLITFLEEKIAKGTLPSLNILGYHPLQYFQFSKAGLKYLLSFNKNNDSSCSTISNNAESVIEKNMQEELPEAWITELLANDDFSFFENLLMPENVINNNHGEAPATPTLFTDMLIEVAQNQASSEDNDIVLSDSISDSEKSKNNVEINFFSEKRKNSFNEFEAFSKLTKPSEDANLHDVYSINNNVDNHSHDYSAKDIDDAVSFDFFK